MGKVGFREENPNWKGGRVVDPRGYVLIRVGVGHHLADVRGYAYEHRLKAEEALGRRLRQDEEVHHDDEIKGNNTPSNLEPLTSLEHGVRHRRGGKAAQMPGEPNITVLCACGCGAEFARYDHQRRERRFLPSHNSRKRKNG